MSYSVVEKQVEEIFSLFQNLASSNVRRAEAKKSFKANYHARKQFFFDIFLTIAKLPFSRF
jgi:hypothetical protein